MRPSLALLLTYACAIGAVPVYRRDVGSSVAQAIGSAVDDASLNKAGNGNTGTAVGNGNDNVGAEANPSDSFNGNDASDIGIANGDGGSIGRRRRRRQLESIGSAVGDASSNLAGDLNSAYAQGNGNDNTGAEADPTSSFDGNSASDVGLSNGDGGSIGKRADVVSLESIGSAVEDSTGNLAGNLNSGDAESNGNGNTGAAADPASSFDGNDADDIGEANDDSGSISRRSLQDELDSIGSAVGDASGNVAGTGNDATATSNGNGNTGAEADPSDSFNGNDADDIGEANGDSGSISRRSLQDELESIGSAIQDASGNVAGTGNDAAATSNGNGNTGAEANPTDSFDGNSASCVGIANCDSGSEGTVTLSPQIDPTLTV